jgi:hypothetical protein
MLEPIFYQSCFLTFYIAIPHRTRESAEANTTRDGGKASNRAVNGGIINTPFVEEYDHARKEIEESNEETAMPRPSRKPKGQCLNLFFIRIVFLCFT